MTININAAMLNADKSKNRTPIAQRHSEESGNSEIEEIWKNLFSCKDTVFWLDYLCSRVRSSGVALDSRKGNFLASIYIESSHASAEVKTHASFLIRELIREDNFGSVTQKLLESHLVEIVLPLFPNYAISHFIGYLAYQSFGTCKYLIENNFVPLLIRCLSAAEGNELFYFVECAGYIGNYREFEDEMEPLIDILYYFIVNDYECSIKTKAIKSISKIVFNSRKLCKKLVSDSQNFQNVLALCGEENKYISDAVLELIGVVLNNKIINDDNVFYLILKIFDSKLKLADECTMIYVVEAIERGLSCKIGSVDETAFPRLCVSSGILSRLIELFSKNTFSFELQSKLFSSICLIFSEGDMEQKIKFLENGFLAFFIDNCFEMIETKAFVIVRFLLNLFDFNLIIKNENLQTFFLNEEIQSVIDLLLSSDDCEIRLLANDLNSKINEVGLF